ncbi:MAG: NAD(P)/FAD-dependent oxidoreductase, partial [Gammaproteobacteria bacterium]
VCDTGQPCNARSAHLNGFLTRDGADPAQFRQIARAQLGRYSSVETRDVAVVDAVRHDKGFEVVLNDGAHVLSRKLLLATGVVDELPDIEGIEDFYGRSVFHCPYCDGWEVRDQPIAAYGRGGEGMGLALELTTWSRDIVLCTNGPAELSERERGRLTANGIGVRNDRIVGLDGADGMLEAIRFASGDSLARRALFFISKERQASDLAFRLGCPATSRGCVEVGSYERTEVPGLYVAGDASRRMQLVIVAAAEGAMAAFAINTELLKEDLN